MPQSPHLFFDLLCEALAPRCGGEVRTVRALGHPFGDGSFERWVAAGLLTTTESAALIALAGGPEPELDRIIAVLGGDGEGEWGWGFDLDRPSDRSHHGSSSGAGGGSSSGQGAASTPGSLHSSTPGAVPRYNAGSAGGYSTGSYGSGARRAPSEPVPRAASPRTVSRSREPRPVAPDDSWGWGADDQSSAIFESLISEDLAVLTDRHRFRLEERFDRTRLFDVHLGRDLLMGRDVALHLLRADGPLGNAAFVRGVRRLALLQHPQIEPVYELDHTADATPFYVTSQRLTLTARTVLREVAQDEPGARARWSLSALLDVLLDVARAVAFAHRAGVIHRDLRPAKIRIGHFGETLLCGWFRARRRQDDPDPLQDGALGIVGSGLGYLAPERLEGGLSAAGVPADVWGLGALLYAMLSRRPPFVGSTKEVAEAIRAGKVVPVTERTREVPEPLAALCMQALEFDPARRRVSADEFVSEIEDYLDGTRTEERRLEQAEERFEDAEQFAGRYRGMRERLRDGWNTEAQSRNPATSAEARDALDVRLELDRMRTETEQAFYEADDAYMRVLSVMPGFDPAHYGLCALYYQALQDVERGRMRAPQHYLRASIRQLDPGGFTDALAASARLEVRTRPAGAGVRFHQYRNRGGVQTPDRGRLIGTTPLAFEELRPGDYVMVLEDDRGRPFVLPVHLDPGEALSIGIRLPDRIPPGCVFIPDGPCRVGADGEAAALLDALPAGRVELGGFSIARDPVSFDDYALFLNALFARDPERAARHAPRGHVGAPPLWRPGPQGYTLPITGRGGQTWTGDMPVVGLTLPDVEAYLGWRSDQDGVAWRLPTELEWEKAARGAEGRPYHWGDRPEPAFCHHLQSDGQGPHLRPIGAIEADRSVYGVRDLAGGVREYTADTQDGARVLRGGSWLFPFSECHLAVRAVLADATPLVALGFRLATDGPQGPVVERPVIVPEPDWVVPEPPRAGPVRDDSGLESAELTVEGRSMLLAPAPVPATPEDDEHGLDLYDTGPDRYTLMDEIARGSMGKVMLAFDRVLQRHVALKLLHDKHRSDKLSRYRFVMEARITGRLQHPTMVPVYDMGVFRGGQRFFAMKVIEGQSLQDVLRARSAGDRRALTDYNRDRLITVMRRVCQGVAFAHERHIVHRDLKPANILLGDFGEVCIVDLGLARQLEPDPSDMADVEEARELARADGRVTRVGSVIGTPYYMSPEQAMGLQDLVDERSDIYGLGAILYHVLAHRPPYSGRKVNEVLAKVRRGNPRPPSLAAPDQDIPRELDDIVLKSLAMDPRDRQESALDLAAELAAWQGRARLIEKAREIARQRAARAVRTFSVVEKEQGQLDQMRARLAELRDDPRGDDIERRRRVVHQQEKIRLQEEQIEAHLALAVRQLRLALDVGQPDIRDRLVTLLKSRCQRAERTRDVGSTAYYAHLLRQLDDGDGALARWLARGAPLAVHTRPDDLQVVVQRVVERKRRLEAGPTVAQGRTPISVPDMPVGSGLATFTRNKGSLRVPFVVLRERPVELELVWPDETYDGFAAIPGGRFLYGGDPLTDEGQAARSARIGTYHIAIHPVTCGEYNTWLESLAPEPEQRAARIPIMGRDGLPLWGPEGQSRFGAYDPRRPVSGITLADAHAYAQWRSRRDGVKYRLPTSAEWEKAARGVDGRPWPWGDHFEPLYCRAETPALGPVGRFTHDVSPYGVRDLVTGVIEWTLTAARDDPNTCYVRGGCSALPLHGHPITARLTRDPRDPSPFIGFRLVIASR